FWHGMRVLEQFLGTAILLGSAIMLLVDSRSSGGLATALFLAAAMKLRNCIGWLTPRNSAAPTPLMRSAQLLTGPLRHWTWFRLGALCLAGVVLPLGIVSGIVAPHPFLAWIVFLTLAAGELAERSLFFRAVSQPKMP